MKRIFTVLCVMSVFLIMGCGSEEKKPVVESKPTPQAEKAKVLQQTTVKKEVDGKYVDTVIEQRDDGKWYDVKTGKRVIYIPGNENKLESKGEGVHKFKE